MGHPRAQATLGKLVYEDMEALRAQAHVHDYQAAEEAERWLRRAFAQGELGAFRALLGVFVARGEAQVPIAGNECPRKRRISRTEHMVLEASVMIDDEEADTRMHALHDRGERAERHGRVWLQHALDVGVGDVPAVGWVQRHSPDCCGGE